MHPAVSNPNFDLVQADAQTSKESIEKAQKALDEAVKGGDEKSINGAKADLAKAIEFENNQCFSSSKEAIEAKEILQMVKFL